MDQQAKSIKYNGTSVSELARLLSAHATTDLEKARIIYTWLAVNIAYDVQGYYTGEYGDLTPEGVLKRRQAVCSGYANLYQALSQEMGLESFIISGYAKGLSYESTANLRETNHAWNGVKINGNWYLVDATWAAGTVDSHQFTPNFNQFYFATPPEQLIYSHLPEDENWQLLTNKYTREQFLALPKVSPHFFTTQLNLLSHGYNSQGNFQVVLTAPENVEIIAGLTVQEEYLPRETVQIQKHNNQIFIIADTSRNKADKLNIFAKFSHQEGSYPHAVSFKVP
ncbi:MAG: hypothetical protein EA365_08490 [Gloeocapsa sp. DLM2.Bin57]|nr:MAG: hypothetical protein EA365_08490 [Gloeocapsa sp. DLM2.Bin57]